jgi:hypothetical protein
MKASRTERLGEVFANVGTTVWKCEVTFKGLTLGSPQPPELLGGWAKSPSAEEPHRRTFLSAAAKVEGCVCEKRLTQHTRILVLAHTA